jgi:putative effector of murein hydrolase LrgA (UPF0299 family)
MLNVCMSSGQMMVPAFLVLLVCQLAGDLLRQMLALPVPGPVIGTSILAAALVFRKEGPPSRRLLIAWSTPLNP